MTLPNPTTRRKYSVELMVVPEALTPLPGEKAGQYIRPIKVKELAAAVSSQAHSRYKDVSIARGDLGTFKEALHPEVDTDAPPRAQPSRGVSTAMKPKLEDVLKRLTDLRLITLVD